MKTILLATDGSPSAEKATATAIELAQATGWRLRVVAVWNTPVQVYGYWPAAYAADVVEIEREHASNVAADAVERAEAAGIAASSQVREGDPIEEICGAARDCDAGLVVLGAHGWGALHRLFFGSVSTGVLHHSTAPVLVVRGEPAAREREPAASAAHGED